MECFRLAEYQAIACSGILLKRQVHLSFFGLLSTLPRTVTVARDHLLLLVWAPSKGNKLCGTFMGLILAVRLAEFVSARVMDGPSAHPSELLTAVTTRRFARDHFSAPQKGCLTSLLVIVY